jgi:hypothetical protein
MHAARLTGDARENEQEATRTTILYLQKDIVSTKRYCISKNILYLQKDIVSTKRYCISEKQNIVSSKRYCISK